MRGDPLSIPGTLFLSWKGGYYSSHQSLCSYFAVYIVPSRLRLRSLLRSAIAIEAAIVPNDFVLLHARVFARSFLIRGIVTTTKHPRSSLPISLLCLLDQILALLLDNRIKTTLAPTLTTPHIFLRSKSSFSTSFDAGSFVAFSSPHAALLSLFLTLLIHHFDLHHFGVYASIPEDMRCNTVSIL